MTKMTKSVQSTMNINNICNLFINLMIQNVYVRKHSNKYYEYYRNKFKLVILKAITMGANCSYH